MSTCRKLTTQHKAFFAIFALSVFIKTLFLLQSPVVNPDAATYIAAAQKHTEGLFAEGTGYYSMPFYPLLLAGIHFIIPDWILAGQLLSAVPLVLSLIPLYLLTLRLFDKQSALAAALLFAVLPVFNEASVEIMRDPLFLLFALSALALLAQNHYRYSYCTLIGAVLFAVLATLVRIEGVLLLVIVPAMLLWQSRHRLSVKSATKALAIVGLSISTLGLILWVFSLLGISSKSRLPEIRIWVENIITLDLLDDYNRVMARLEEFQRQLPASHLRNNILEITRHYAPLIYLLGLIEILIKEIWPFSLIGLWALRYRTLPLLRSPRVLLFWTMAAFLLLGMLFCISKNFITTRYVWIPIALLIPLIGHGITLILQRLAHRKLAVIALSVLFFAGPATKTLAQLESDRPSITQAAIWLKQKDPNRELNIIFNDRRLLLYTDRIYAPNYGNAFNIIKKNKNWKPRADLFILKVGNKELDQLPLEGFREVKIFEDRRTRILVLERDD
jgi:4-amino-4-deoxy-L-arabinose transferase-like glycosyltransferase